MGIAMTDRQRIPMRAMPRVERLLVLLLVAWAAVAFGVSRQPGADASQPAPELRLQIGPAGTYALDGQRVDQGKLAAALQQARERSPGLRLQIAAADGSDNDAFVRALASAQDAGIRNIGSEMR
jgi:biopolymer transport protein ExbD